MGIASPTASFDPPPPPDPADLDGLCPSLPDRYQRACWTSLWQFYPASIQPDDLLSRLAGICEAAGADYCFEGLGTAAYFRGLGADRGDSPETVAARASLALARCSATRAGGTGTTACGFGVGAAAALWWSTLGWSFDSYLSPCARTEDPDVAAGCRNGESGQASGADPTAPPFPS